MYINRYESLLNEIKEKGMDALKNIILRKDIEQFFVDFKKTEFQDYSGKVLLAKNDRKNLAKAISGFGNSEGGLIIWGIDTKGEIDAANSFKPIISPENFLSLINNQISRLTIPQHPNVEGIIIKDNNDSPKGFVITIIPKYEGLPIQVIDGYRFYMRYGDSFIPISNTILAGMFGKRPNPDLNVGFLNYEKSIKVDGETIFFHFGVTISNGGKGIARDIFLNCYSYGITTKFQFKDHTNFQGYFVISGFNLISKPEFRMGPEQFANPVIYYCQLTPPFQNEIKFMFLVGADGQVPNRLDIVRTKKEVEKIYESYMGDNNFKLIDEILKIKKI